MSISNFKFSNGLILPTESAVLNEAAIQLPQYRDIDWVPKICELASKLIQIGDQSADDSKVMDIFPKFLEYTKYLVEFSYSVQILINTKTPKVELSDLVGEEAQILCNLIGYDKYYLLAARNLRNYRMNIDAIGRLNLCAKSFFYSRNSLFDVRSLRDSATSYLVTLSQDELDSQMAKFSFQGWSNKNLSFSDALDLLRFISSIDNVRNFDKLDTGSIDLDDIFESVERQIKKGPAKQPSDESYCSYSEADLRFFDKRCKCVINSIRDSEMKLFETNNIDAALNSLEQIYCTLINLTVSLAVTLCTKLNHVQYDRGYATATEDLLTAIEAKYGK